MNDSPSVFQPPDANSLERRIHDQFVSDGMLELLLGSLFVVVSIVFAFTDSVFALLPLIPLVWLVRSVWRKRVLYPRVGYAEVMDHPPVSMWFMLWTGMMALIVGRLLATGMGRGLESLAIMDSGMTRQTLDGMHFTMLNCGLAYHAVWPRRIKPHYAYLIAAFLYVLFMLVVALRFSPGVALAGIGIIVIAIGLARLRVFLLRNPRLIDTEFMRDAE